MSLVRADVITAVRQNLKEHSANAMFTDTELGNYIDQTLREIAMRQPKINRACLALTARSIDVSYLTIQTLSKTTELRVEYPVGNGGYRPIYRNYARYGGEVKLDLSAIPLITSGTLTGTITFTANSQTVTGNGSKFLTALVAGDNGYLICKSSDSQWYQIASIESNTSLTLEQPYEGTSGADTVSLTKYRDRKSCVRIEYGGPYTVTTTSNLPASLDEVLRIGTFANALWNYVSSKITADDLQGDADLASARTGIDKSNPGADIAGKYTNLAQLEKVEAFRSSLGALQQVAVATLQYYQSYLDTLGLPEFNTRGNYPRD